MGKEELHNRAKWQDQSGAKAMKAEELFFAVLQQYFIGSDFEVRSHPKEFNKIYLEIPLSSSVMSEIYTPDEPINRHGISPDFAIRNRITNKTLYVEIKRQDGWVEGKERSAGRGNAHERLCKYFTPGLLKILGNSSQINSVHLPFWVVFVGDITRDPLRVREITCWFDKYNDHVFFWRDINNVDSLVNHFDEKLKHVLG